MDCAEPKDGGRICSAGIARVLQALAEGLSVSATSRVFEHRRRSIQTWADRGAVHMSKLHERVLHGLHLAHKQLYELRTRLKGQCVCDMGVDRIRGQEQGSTGDPCWTWIVDSRLVYEQMIIKYVRRKVQAVRRVILSGSLFVFVSRLRAVGRSGLINTAFVERHNLLLRMSVSPLIRRSWSLVYSELALTRRLELQRGFYHFSKPHGGLRIKLTQPLSCTGRRIPKRYLQQTPMMAAGLSDRILSFEEVLLHPLPDPDILMLLSA